MLPFVHCTTAATTPVGTSSLQHLRRNFHAISFVSILVAASLILLIIIPCEPLSIPYVFFVSSTRDFSLVLSSRYCVRFSPIDGRPVIKEMSSTSMEMSYYNHKNPSWRTSINFLMHLFTSFPLPKWGISNKFKILCFPGLQPIDLDIVLGIQRVLCLFSPCTSVAQILGICWCETHHGMDILAFPHNLVELGWPAPSLECAVKQLRYRVACMGTVRWVFFPFFLPAH
jgi:hypothetical protein